jgi:hypothetical protein
VNATSLVKYAGALVALAICSACAGALPLSLSKGQDDMTVAPSTAALSGTYVGRTLLMNGRPVTAARLSLSPLPRYATIVPDRHHGHKKFEYTINFYGSFAGIFDYPKSDKQWGTINDVGGQGCTNVLYGYGKKIIWIVAGYNQITEYRVPQKPIKTLSVSDGSMPSSCAMDTSGNLAVGILDGPSTGDVVIYANASGSGTFIHTPLAREYFDGYDDKGNLFFDGFTSAYDFALIELPKGSTQPRIITTSNSVEFPGSVQWDGKYVTVFDQLADNLYQYEINGTQAILKGTVSLSGVGDCAQTWIAKGVIYCGDDFNDDGSVFNYPAGGSALAVFTGNFDEPLGTVAAER